METKEQTISRLRRMAKEMRIQALQMAFGAGKNGAHLGPAMSCIEILAVLYGQVMRFDPKQPNAPERDRFIPSKAHCVLALYAALQQSGWLTGNELATFEHNGTFLAGHPARDLSHGIEYSGGSLGMALGFSLGVALDAKQKGIQRESYVLLGDGELNEGSNWEAFLSAPALKLEHITVIIDKNKLQYDGPTEEIVPLGDLAAKLRTFGWFVQEVDGHDIDMMLEAFAQREAGKPRAIIAHTVKGKGVSFMENAAEWHHSVLSQTQFEQAMSELGAGA